MAKNASSIRLSGDITQRMGIGLRSAMGMAFGMAELQGRKIKCAFYYDSYKGR